MGERQQKRLAYFGPTGTYTEEAAIRYGEREGIEPSLTAMATITAVYNAVQSGMADEGVVPIENSLEGSVPETLDVLVHSDPPLVIRDEITIPIDHCLLVKPGTQANDVEAVYAHPQALGQCRGFIERCFPKARVEAALSNAAAVEEMMAQNSAAAIAPRRAAEIYGAEVLAQGIQDRTPNLTRFVVLAHADHEPTGDDKTSIALAFDRADRPGVLVEALKRFAQRDINLSKIESRPSKEKLGTYIFLIDVDGHASEPKIAEAMEETREICSFLRVLGSYPRRGEAA
jgi:prephenate dehydratase